jgi:flagellar biosynthesis/type III secretory pathway chaperone
MAVADIVTVLNQMSELHEQLYVLGTQKKDALIANDVDTITQITQKETRLMKQIAELDKLRSNAVVYFLQEKGLRPQTNMTMSDLLKVVFKAEEKQQLSDAQSRLLAVLEQLKEQNERNRQLIEQSLAFINYSLDLVTGGDEDPVYHNPKADMNRMKRTGYFDTRA